MCGIAGILKFRQGAHAEDTRLTAMRAVLQHRGPDDHGLRLLGPAGLAHCRLSIIDVESGRQPMTSADGRICLSFNGEIYNFRELRRSLQELGCTFTTRSDTEVLLRAYETFGEDCVDHLQGMFAFAVWDARRDALFLARDRLGIKPLYYARRKDELLFGSEIKAILAAGGLGPELNRAILPEYLATRYIGGRETFFRGVFKLLPGRTQTWSLRGTCRERRYWRLPETVDEPSVNHEEQAAMLLDKLRDAVRSHLVSDVPLGVFLSGGVDSTGLAALMAGMVDGPLRTFSVGFDVPECNELPYARLAARAVKSIHREVMVSPADFFESLPRLVWHEDEPMAFTSSVPLHFVSRLARDSVKVVLTGEGADELFLGYNRYRVTDWNERLGRLSARVLPGAVTDAVARLVPGLPRPLRRFAERSFLALGPGMREMFFENFAVFNSALQQDLLDEPALLKFRDPYEAGLRCLQAAPAGTLERLSHADLQTYLVELLMKQDQMSMAASIESRVPFLDHRFVEFAMTMPGNYKLRGWRTKAVLRAALRDLVPPAILARRKMGFPVPLGRWLSGPFAHVMQEFVLGPRTLGRNLFRPAFLQRLVHEHREGRVRNDDRLWLLINLEVWQRIFLDGEAPDAVMQAAHTPVCRSAA